MMNFNIIYKVVNIETNEVYIGSTSKSLEERKQDHLQKAKKKVGSYFQEAIGTYGPEAFTWEQIDTALSNDELASKEIMHIFEYGALGNIYNTDKGGGFKKTIYKYNLDGSLSESFENLTFASETIGVRKQDVSRACWNVNHTLGGYFWSYENTESFVPELDNRKKQVIQSFLDGDFIAQYISVAEASRESGLSKTCIARCCREERESSGGFLWKYS